MILDGEAEASAEASAELAKDIKSAVSYMIQKEKLLLVTQDSRVKNERWLCINITADLSKMGLDG